jgi:hypothetical protein
VVVSDTPLEDGMVFVHFETGTSQAAPVAGLRTVKKQYIRQAIASVLEGEVKSRAEEGRDPVPEPEVSAAPAAAIALEQQGLGGAPSEEDAGEMSPGARIVAPVAAKKQQKAAEEALADAERKVRITRYRRMSAVELVKDEDEENQARSQAICRCL